MLTSKKKANRSPTPPVTMSQSHYITHLMNKGSLEPHTLTLITKLQSEPLPSSKPSPHVITHGVRLLAPWSLGSLEARDAREIETLTIGGPSRCRCRCLHIKTPSQLIDNAAGRGKHVANSAVATWHDINLALVQ